MIKALVTFKFTALKLLRDRSCMKDKYATPRITFMIAAHSYITVTTVDPCRGEETTLRRGL